MSVTTSPWLQSRLHLAGLGLLSECATYETWVDAKLADRGPGAGTRRPGDQTIGDRGTAVSQREAAYVRKDPVENLPIAGPMTEDRAAVVAVVGA